MAENSVFQKKYADTIAQDKKAILEELNLPPALIDFVRKNARMLKIAGIVFIVLFVGWESYDKYRSVQRENSAALLYAASTTENLDLKKSQFKELSEKYAGSGSGVWGTVELGHLAFKDKYYEDAVKYYKSALKNLAGHSPLRPLVQLNLAQSYENMGDLAQAQTAYQALLELTGFAGEGYLGLARLAEKDGNADQALSSYQEYVNLAGTQAGQTKEWVDYKISQLKP